MMPTFEVNVGFNFRNIAAPSAKHAEVMALNWLTLNGFGAVHMIGCGAEAKEQLFGSERVPPGPRNPNRTDVGVDGHKKPEESPAEPQLVIAKP